MLPSYKSPPIPHNTRQTSTNTILNLIEPDPILDKIQNRKRISDEPKHQSISIISDLTKSLKKFGNLKYSIIPPTNKTIINHQNPLTNDIYYKIFRPVDISTYQPLDFLSKISKKLKTGKYGVYRQSLSSNGEYLAIVISDPIEVNGDYPFVFDIVIYCLKNICSEILSEFETEIHRDESRRKGTDKSINPRSIRHSVYREEEIRDKKSTRENIPPPMTTSILLSCSATSIHDLKFINNDQNLICSTGQGEILVFNIEENNNNNNVCLPIQVISKELREYNNNNIFILYEMDVYEDIISIAGGPGGIGLLRSSVDGYLEVSSIYTKFSCVNSRIISGKFYREKGLKYVCLDECSSRLHIFNIDNFKFISHLNTISIGDAYGVPYDVNFIETIGGFAVATFDSKIVIFREKILTILSHNAWIVSYLIIRPKFSLSRSGFLVGSENGKGFYIRLFLDESEKIDEKSETILEKSERILEKSTNIDSIHAVWTTICNHPNNVVIGDVTFSEYYNFVIFSPFGPNASLLPLLFFGELVVDKNEDSFLPKIDLSDWAEKWLNNSSDNPEFLKIKTQILTHLLNKTRLSFAPQQTGRRIQSLPKETRRDHGSFTHSTKGSGPFPHSTPETSSFIHSSPDNRRLTHSPEINTSTRSTPDRIEDGNTTIKSIPNKVVESSNEVVYDESLDENMIDLPSMSIPITEEIDEIDDSPLPSYF